MNRTSLWPDSSGAAIITVPSDGCARGGGVRPLQHDRRSSWGSPGWRARGALLGAAARSPTGSSRMSGDIDVAVVKERGQARRAPGTPALLVPATADRALLVRCSAPSPRSRWPSMLALPRHRLPVGVHRLPHGRHRPRLRHRPSARHHGRGSERPAVGLLLHSAAFTFTIGKLEDVLMFFLYFVTAAALAFLMSRLRTSQRMLKVREQRMTALYGFSQALSEQHDLAGIVRTSLERMSRTFEAECLLFLRDPAGALWAGGARHSRTSPWTTRSSAWPSGASPAEPPAVASRTR